jgi:hypothetical protein
VKGGVQVHRVLELTGLGDVLTIVESPEELFEVDVP